MITYIVVSFVSFYAGLVTTALINLAHTIEVKRRLP